MSFRVAVAIVLATMSLGVRAQISGSVAQFNCGALITDNRAVLGELYVMKTHNPGTGPDSHQDWVFDLSAKGGGAVTGTDAGGPTWTAPDNFHQNTTPPEEEFMVMTYPGGFVAIDSIGLRGMPDSMGVVQRQHVGDSLPVGTANGIGLVLPGDASTYTVGNMMDRRTGQLAEFPLGTPTGIEVAFAPIAELNPAMIGGSGCSIGGEVPDQASGRGLISGYNVYRIPGVATLVPTAADFLGAWQYYIPFDAFDLTIADTGGTAGPDTNNDGRPDGDGTPAPNDGVPNDLAGLMNPDGQAYTGDEVILFQDSARNPDGTPRVSGTAPDPALCYWYAFQPVLFQGPTTLQDWDGLGFSRADEFLGIHALDLDSDGVFESLDLDLDGVREFYSPQAVIGQTGLGLTNSGLPVLSAPVFGCMNADPAPALMGPRIEAAVTGSRVELTLHSGLELADVIGFEVRRASRGQTVLLAPGFIAARGGEGNAYRLSDRIPYALRRTSSDARYTVDVIFQGMRRETHGPFVVGLPAGSERRVR